MKTLRIATACFLNDTRALLVVRKRGTQAWMLPGGKLDGDETPQQALVRELHEELALAVRADALQPLGQFAAPAANEADTQVSAQVFCATLPAQQVPTIGAEIAAMQWLPLDAPLPDHVAPLLRHHIIPALRAHVTPAAADQA